MDSEPFIDFEIRLRILNTCNALQCTHSRALFLLIPRGLHFFSVHLISSTRQTTKYKHTVSRSSLFWMSN
jgi:hypothetical protein